MARRVGTPGKRARWVPRSGGVFTFPRLFGKENARRRRGFRRRRPLLGVRWARGSGARGDAE